MLVLVLSLSACSNELGSGRDGGRRDGGSPRDGSAPVDDGAMPPSDGSTPADGAGPMDGGIATDGGPDGGPPLVCFPATVDCSPSPVTMEDGCFDGTSCYLRNVQMSIRNVIAARPEIFMTTDVCEIILDVDAFMDAVVAELVAMGVCAIRDPNAPGEEVTVKTGNVFTENFDIVASTGCARLGDPIYTSTCTPAWW